MIQVTPPHVTPAVPRVKKRDIFNLVNLTYASSWSMSYWIKVFPRFSVFFYNFVQPSTEFGDLPIFTWTEKSAMCDHVFLDPHRRTEGRGHVPCLLAYLQISVDDEFFLSCGSSSTFHISVPFREDRECEATALWSASEKNASQN